LSQESIAPPLPTETLREDKGRVGERTWSVQKWQLQRPSMENLLILENYKYGKIQKT
jgi:hypothetical protein